MIVHHLHSEAWFLSMVSWPKGCPSAQGLAAFAIIDIRICSRDLVDVLELVQPQAR